MLAFMSALPTGTVTFLFTDIEGSTQRWEEHPDAMRAALERHDAVMRAAVETNEGHVFKTVGDAFCAAFAAEGEEAQARAWLPELSADHVLRAEAKECRWR